MNGGVEWGYEHGGAVCRRRFVCAPASFITIHIHRMCFFCAILLRGMTTVVMTYMHPPARRMIGKKPDFFLSAPGLSGYRDTNYQKTCSTVLH
ncbi:hypothetical protein L227DRAFT_421626 [Lentinus tigrinus ALCF2SS1-6]|uniref:Uncharacterized protein n=1 Tax=Lentinus tigrinus ALCF2SS1-6 TaxID=1328759 RepID=A0A5C2RRK9_9APHY|nr:hypothetical protein L227DRAFT_421626 [Lentinus tigrinus ALCF2SS1-6]